MDFADGTINSIQSVNHGCNFSADLQNFSGFNSEYSAFDMFSFICLWASLISSRKGWPLNDMYHYTPVICMLIYMWLTILVSSFCWQNVRVHVMICIRSLRTRWPVTRILTAPAPETATSSYYRHLKVSSDLHTSIIKSHIPSLLLFNYEFHEIMPFSQETFKAQIFVE